MEIVKTVCGLCSQNDCGMDVFVEDEKIIKIRGMREHPYNQGVPCPKGLAAGQLTTDPHRLKKPLKRIGERGEGRWKEVSWDEALDLAAEKLDKIRRKYSPLAVGMFRGAGPGWGGSWPYTQRFLHAYGTPNYAMMINLCFGPRLVALRTSYGGLFEPDFDNANCILLWGSNPVETSLPNYWRRISDARRRGAKLIVIDPRHTRTSDQADLHVPIRPGTDGALALALANIIISEELYDRNFIMNYVHGFEDFRKIAAAYTSKITEELTGVPRGMIKEIALLYAKTRPAALLTGNGIEQQTNAAQTVRAIQLLPALTGNIAVRGGQVLTPSLPWPDVPLKEHYNAGLAKHSVTQHRIFEPDSLIGPDLIDAIRTSRPYPIKGLFVLGAPLIAYPRGDKLEDACRENLEFILVHDLFMSSEAQKIADLVLPAASFLECSRLRTTRVKADPFTHHIALQNRAVKPVGESRPDEELFFELGRRLGLEKYFPWDDALTAAGDALKPLGTSLKELKEHPGGKVWHYPDEDTICFYERKGFSTPTGKAEFYNTTFEQMGYEPLPDYKKPELDILIKGYEKTEYPLTCINGLKSILYTHTQFRTLSYLGSILPEPWVAIHPEKAAELGIKEGDRVIVESPQGHVELTACLTFEICFPEHVFMPYGWGQAYIGGPVTNHISPEYPRDPVTGSTANHNFRCRIKKL